MTWRRSQIRHHAERHARRHGQSRLRSGRGRSRRREPHRVRDVLLRARPFFVEGTGCISSSSTATSSSTAAPTKGCSTRGASGGRRRCVGCTATPPPPRDANRRGRQAHRPHARRLVVRLLDAVTPRVVAASIDRPSSQRPTTPCCARSAIYAAAKRASASSPRREPLARLGQQSVFARDGLHDRSNVPHRFHQRQYELADNSPHPACRARRSHRPHPA
jgi:hypothetical protein